MIQPMHALHRALTGLIVLVALVCSHGFGQALSTSFPTTFPTNVELPGAIKTEYVTITPALNYDALQPGQQAVLAVVLDIKEHYHAQSHVPSSPDYIKTEVKIEPNPALKLSSPLYPPGKDIFPPALGKLNVYEGRTI